MIAKRTVNGDAQCATRNTSIHIRIPMKASREFASMQGLCHAHGHKETLGELFETVFIPAMREYVSGYAESAKKQRQERSARKGRVK